MACEFQAWESVENGRWYWHLLDDQENIVATGGAGAGHATYDDARDECSTLLTCVEAERKFTLNIIDDPNA